MKLFEEIVGWTVIPLGFSSLLLWGGATLPHAWYQNRGADIAVENCWYALTFTLVVIVFCGAFVLNVFNVRRAWSIAVLAVSSLYGLAAFGGALLMMYGVTPFWHRMANDGGFFGVAAISAAACLSVHAWLSVRYTAG